MPFGMGLNKNRHGTYEARKKVPQHLEEVVARVLSNGKPKQVWLKRTLATKDFTEAKRRVKAVQIEFDRMLEKAQELLTERPPRDTLSDAEIKLIADYHYAEMLHEDDEAHVLRLEGQTAIELTQLGRRQARLQRRCRDVGCRGGRTQEFKAEGGFGLSHTLRSSLQDRPK